MKTKIMCGAFARTTGKPCKAKALKNGRCRLHGGLSSSFRTPAGKARLSVALKERMASGQKEKAKAGYQAWLALGGREILRHRALRREKLKRFRKGFATITRDARLGLFRLVG